MNFRYKQDRLISLVNFNDQEKNSDFIDYLAAG